MAKPKQTKKVELATDTSTAIATDISTPTHDREKAIELSREGFKLYNAGDTDKAEDLYNQSIEADPSYFYPYNAVGSLYNNIKKDSDKAIEFFKKAILLEPLYKLAVDNLIIRYNGKGDDESKKLAKEVQRDYDNALQNSINKNTKNHKNTQEKIDQLTTDMEKLEQNTDVEILTANLAASDQALKDILQDEIKIKDLLADASVSAMSLKNHELAGYFDKKTEELEIEKTVFEGSFKKMIKYNIIFLATSIVLNLGGLKCVNLILLFMEKTPYAEPLFLDSIAQGIVITTPIMILLLWLTKYYNRRLHETIHLIEEYKHKSIVLYSFTAYSEQLKILGGDDKTPLLDYTQKVSTTINQSPTHALTRKKTDKIPTGEIVELLNAMHPLRYNNNNSNNGKTG